MQLSILNDTILQPGVLFYQTQTLILAVSARRHVVRNKVPWLCVTASRRFCRQVFIFLKQNLQTFCSAFSLLVLQLYTPQNFLSSIFKHFSQFVCKFKPCFSQKTPKISNEIDKVNIGLLTLKLPSKMGNKHAKRAKNKRF